MFLEPDLQRNLSKLNDWYLLENSLTVLSNLSAHMESLHPYASQRLVAALVTCMKKYGPPSVLRPSLPCFLYYFLYDFLPYSPVLRPRIISSIFVTVSSSSPVLPCICATIRALLRAGHV